jgi:hypothetical protein
VSAPDAILRAIQYLAVCFAATTGLANLSPSSSVKWQSQAERSTHNSSNRNLPPLSRRVAARNSRQELGLYLISGSTSSNSTNLYALDRQGSLRLVRAVLTVWPYEIEDDQQGTLYAIPPDIGFPSFTGEPLTKISIIHEDAPEIADTVAVDQDNFALPTGEAIPIAALSPTESCLVVPARGVGVLRIMGSGRPGQPRKQPGKWSDFRSLRYQSNGWPAGNVQPRLGGWMDANIIAGPGHVFHVYGAVIATAPPYSPPCIACATASILAASDRFIAVQFGSDDLWVYDKVVRKWRSQPMPSQPTTQSQSPFYRDPRIFGVWLAGADTPDGALQLRSLLTGQTIDLPAAANGGEVLAINHMGTILYKSNDSLFSVSLKGEQLGAPVLLATSPVIAEVHWAFWSRSQ